MICFPFFLVFSIFPNLSLILFPMSLVKLFPTPNRTLILSSFGMLSTLFPDGHYFSAAYAFICNYPYITPHINSTSIIIPNETYNLPLSFCPLHIKIKRVKAKPLEQSMAFIETIMHRELVTK